MYVVCHYGALDYLDLSVVEALKISFIAVYSLIQMHVTNKARCWRTAMSMGRNSPVLQRFILFGKWDMEQSLYCLLGVAVG